MEVVVFVEHGVQLLYIFLFFRSFCLRLSSVVVVTVDSERSKSHDVFELGVQCGWSTLMFRRIIQRRCR